MDLVDHLDRAGVTRDARRRGDARRSHGEVSRRLGEDALLRLKLSLSTSTLQGHSKHFPARLISDQDLIARDIARALVPGKVPRHPDRLLHNLVRMSSSWLAARQNVVALILFLI
jgi:hypothetical protein